MSDAGPHACVIGWPVAHSRSPLIHNYWLKKAGIDGFYDVQTVAPENLGAFFSQLRDGVFVGCNVTVPHKQAVLEQVDEVTALATRLNSANTIYWQHGRLVADSSDGGGFIAHLKASARDLDLPKSRVMLLGAGGAARAIAGALQDENVIEITVANRTARAAEKLAQSLGGAIDICLWEDAGKHLAKCDLLVNATVLGMTGKPPLALDISDLARSAIVADIVYAPLQTQLLKAARARGLGCVDGLGMLLHQAVRGFEKWFGVKPVVDDELKQLVIRDLEAAL